ncbi:DNA topoisomerase II large subunit [Pseudomonas phage Lu11]|uniref:DNA topoisomerase II large subunit n=1 Tax=Pseudomonas phage Lu11 TaxID=1161927 RepID=UPI00025F17B8|nr:DNA topoisomerase II large subunit [Pseudomonas phage Lu11]AFH14678.1 topoisomerase IV subunit B protein [Pseudomonas phage Lu11]
MAEKKTPKAVKAKPAAETKTKKTKVAEGVEKTTRKKSASQDDFTILEGLSGIRHNPSMYLGERGAPMAYRCIKEAVDNCYDEHIAGRNKVIEVILDYDTGCYIVADQAGGIPTDFKKLEDGTKISIMTAAYTKTHAGAKFNDKAYKTSAGTHGIGMSAVNAVSERMRVWTMYNGKLATQVYSKGKIASKGDHPIPAKAVDKDVMDHLKDKLKKYGTIVAIELDQTVVSEDARRGKDLPKNFRKSEPIAAEVASWLSNVAMLNPGLEIRFASIVKGKRKDETFLNKKDLAFVPKDMCEQRDLVAQGKPFVFKNDNITCALVWSDHTDADHFLSFVNTSPTVDGGWHVTGFTAALSKAVKKHVPEKKPAKGKKGGQGYTGSDLLIGLTGMFDWRMHGAAYTSQVKDKLSSKVDKEVEELLFPAFDAYFKANPKVAKDIIKRALIMTKGREELAAVVKSMADVKKKGKTTLPVKLAVAPHCKPHERELFVVEGDSAKGPSVDARDGHFQEVLAAGGKPLNALKATMAKVLGHEEISNFLVAMGADVKSLDPKAEKPTISTDKLRVANVFFLVDPDPDGFHIAVLYLAAIYRLMPQLYHEGRVFCVQAPLYAALDSKGTLYGGMTFDECRSAAPKSVKDQDIVRIKGWGEVGPEYIGPIAFDKRYRKLIRINPFESVADEQHFRAVVSEDAVNRRRLLGLND